MGCFPCYNSNHPSTSYCINSRYYNQGSMAQRYNGATMGSKTANPGGIASQHIIGRY